MPILNSYAKLREVLFQIEKDLGIEELTETERKVLAALANLSGGTKNNVSLDDIRQDVIRYPGAVFIGHSAHYKSLAILAILVANGLGCIICVNRRSINCNQPSLHFGHPEIGGAMSKDGYLSYFGDTTS